VEEAFLQALHAEPNDEATWLALADWLEEYDQEQRAELVRLVRRLRALPLWEQTEERKQMEARVAELLNSGVRPVVPELVNSIGMRLALIPTGIFRMGSPEDEEGRSADEGPLHEVEITRPFYMGVFPVTQAQWCAVMESWWHALTGNNPSHFSASGTGKDKVRGMNTDDFPVECVSWEDVTTFLKKLSALKREREEGREYRLPTEAEWEYACRGGACSSAPFHHGDSLSSTQANFAGYDPYGGADKGPYLERTCKVGSFRPNAFGLHDMHGNVCELCSDWYDAENLLWVIRSGSWRSNGRGCRSAHRRGSWANSRRTDVGFRVALVLSAQQ
jgi:uncharacterized protein (TIGR02996 family)